MFSIKLFIAMLIASILLGCGGPVKYEEYVRYCDMIGTKWWAIDYEAQRLESWEFYEEYVELWSYTYTSKEQITKKGTVIPKGTITRSAKSIGTVLHQDRFFTDTDGDSYYVFDLSWRAYGEGTTPLFDNGVYDSWFIFDVTGSTRDSTTKLLMGRLGLPNEKQWYYTFSRTQSELGVEMILSSLMERSLCPISTAAQDYTQKTKMLEGTTQTLNKQSAYSVHR